MKACSKCKQVKPFSEFQRQASHSSGYRSSCKKCTYAKTIDWNRSRRGIVTRMWHRQHHRSEFRGHPAPEYTREWLFDFVLNHEDFDSLYKEYVESGFDKYKIPSIDRVNDRVGYTKENIRLVSFADNMEHCWSAGRKSEFDNDGWDNGTLKPHTPVVQLDLSGAFIAEHMSISEAARSIGSISGNSKIPMVCQGKRKTHAGFKWAYKRDYDHA